MRSGHSRTVLRWGANTSRHWAKRPKSWFCQFSQFCQRSGGGSQNIGIDHEHLGWSPSLWPGTSAVFHVSNDSIQTYDVPVQRQLSAFSEVPVKRSNSENDIKANRLPNSSWMKIG